MIWRLRATRRLDVLLAVVLVCAAVGSAGAGDAQVQTPGAPEAPASPSAAPPAASSQEKVSHDAPAPMAAESTEPGQEAAPEPAPKDVRLTFNFRFQPWAEVLNWFAQQAGFSLVMDAPPTGTFNYTDERSYTPAEAIDLLNGVLLTKGYTLVLRGRMLMLINLEDGIPPNLVSTVTTKELDERGEFELVATLFPLENLRPEEAEAEIKKLLGPQGSVVVLPKAQQILVTETAGRLRTIREVIQRADNPDGAGLEQVQWFDVPSTSAEETLGMIRQMFNIPAGQNAAPDGSIRMAWDPASMRLLVSGRPAKLEQIAKILQAVVPGASDPSARAASASLQLEVYEVYPADPESVLKVMQTLLTGSPGVRLATDPKTGSLIALARPTEHATIRATIEQMRRDAQRVEVWQLRIADPQAAAQAIQKLFGSDGKAPSVQADAATRQLLVRGTESQVQQIRSLLEKMGETDLVSTSTSSGGTVRVLPIPGRAARSALERMQEVWPAMHPNQIRVVTPSAVIPSLRPSSGGEASPQRLPGRPPAWSSPFEEEPLEEPPAPASGAPPSASPPAPAEKGPDLGPASHPQTPGSTPSDLRPRADKRAGISPWGQIFFAAETQADKTQPAQDANDKASPPSTGGSQPDGSIPSKQAAPIVVAPGPGGVVIASDDVKALDAFEAMLRSLAGTSTGGTPNLTIFYLKHAKAASVAETLDRVFGGGTLPREYYTSTQPQQAMPMGMPGMPFGVPGPSGGGPQGAPSGPSSSGSSSAPPPNQFVQITPDTRLNALIVRASPTDLDTIEELLKILDQRESPEEILAQPKPRLIPVYNTQADQIAEILKQVYQDRIGSSGASPSSSTGPPSPGQFMMMFRSGRSFRNAQSTSRTTDETQRMSIGVDPRTNSVIVAAPEPLFEEVKQLVEQLDNAARESTQAVRVVTLHKADLGTVEQALSSLVGESIQVTRTAGGAASTGVQGGPAPSSQPRTSSRSRSSSRRQGSRLPSQSPAGMPQGFPSPFGGPR